jgi:hypothetical protein
MTCTCRAGRLALPLLACLLSPMTWTQDLPKRDEVVVLFPTAAHQDPDGSTWVVPVHGWIYEPEEDSILRGALLDLLADHLDLDEATLASATFRDRAAAFLVDSERSKELGVQVGETTQVLPASDPGGHCFGELRVPVADSPDGELLLSVVTDPQDDRAFTGRAVLVPPEGISVISDIDDTIKISQVLDHAQLLANTFLREFRPVPGMAALYQAWAETGVQVHYVSSSPWQLYLPLRSFLEEHGFPMTSMHLKRFRVKDETFLDLLMDPRIAKPRVIEPILEQFPGRRFVLVGDSGEQDPEVYGDIARRHPEQVLHVFIRNASDETPDSERLRAAFQDLDPDRWQLFTDPAEIAFRFPEAPGQADGPAPRRR